jgi:membrane protein implicated in regulation of membrane protease activity
VILRRRRPDNRPIPDHPYRDTALVYGVMAIVLVIVASLTGGDPLRATVAAVLFFVIATAWSWWRYREKIKLRAEEQAAAAAAAAKRRPAVSNGNGNGNGRGGQR